MIEDSSQILMYIGQGFHFLLTIVLIVAAIILVYKKKHISTSLILIGTILTFLSQIGFVIVPILANNGMSDFMTVQGLLSLFNGISRLVFIVGLIWFGVKLEKHGAIFSNE